MEQNNKPEKKYKIGAVSASIWKRTHTTKDGGSFEKWSVSLDRTYKDRNGNWQTTSSYDTNDVPKALLALSQAYRHIVNQPTSNGNGSSDVVVEEVS